MKRTHAQWRELWESERDLDEEETEALCRYITAMFSAIEVVGNLPFDGGQVANIIRKEFVQMLQTE